MYCWLPNLLLIHYESSFYSPFYPCWYHYYFGERSMRHIHIKISIYCFSQVSRLFFLRHMQNTKKELSYIAAVSSGRLQIHSDDQRNLNYTLRDWSAHRFCYKKHHRSNKNIVSTKSNIMRKARIVTKRRSLHNNNYSHWSRLSRIHTKNNILQSTTLFKTHAVRSPSSAVVST